MNNHSFRAPEYYEVGDQYVFLAGTIDNGNSVDWQEHATNYILHNSVYSVLNPRRKEWDGEWKQSKDNPLLVEQVKWEHEAMCNSDVILMYFANKSVSPITLLELGMFATSGKLVVCCDRDFWRLGNVEIICDMYNIPLVYDLDEALMQICD